MSDAAEPYPAMVSPARRWLTRLAFATAAAAAVLLLTVAGLRGVILLAVGAAGLVATLAGVWWFLNQRARKCAITKSLPMNRCDQVMPLATIEHQSIRDIGKERGGNLIDSSTADFFLD